MLLKGDEGGAGGVAENGDFRQGSHYPWVILGGGVDQSQRYG
jgi:hypothetical protein